MLGIVAWVIVIPGGALICHWPAAPAPVDWLAGQISHPTCGNSCCGRLQNASPIMPVANQPCAAQPALHRPSSTLKVPAAAGALVNVNEIAARTSPSSALRRRPMRPVLLRRVLRISLRAWDLDVEGHIRCGEAARRDDPGGHSECGADVIANPCDGIRSDGLSRRWVGV